MTLLPKLDQTARELEQSFDAIPADQKALLRQLSAYVAEKRAAGAAVKLVFICTHNSRRSHMAQLWAQAAAVFFGIPDVTCYSGGTEATAFNPRAVEAMLQLGFDIQQLDGSANPKYNVRIATDAAPVEVWSKRFDDAANPKAGFCAIMTCSDADEKCPLVPGVEKRIGITYDDPKNADGTSGENIVYLERARQIGRDMLYVFSHVKRAL